MEFKFDHEPMCLFCEKAHKIEGSCMVMCEKKGAVDEEYCCKKFKYNLLARIPKRRASIDFSKYSKEDFEF